MKRNKFLYSLIALAVFLFCAVSLGGCGGSSSNSFSSGGDNPNNPDNPAPNNPIAEEDSATRAETTLDVSFSMDSDKNGKPDFLDFHGVPQIHFDNSVSSSSGRISASSSILAAAEMNVTVPSMIWLNKLRPQSEDANIFLVPLDKGQEYTFEFSRNFTEDLGGVLPNIKFYDPSNSLLSLDVAEAIDDVTIAAYPPEHPSIVCYTITPEVSGSYIVKLANGEPTTNESADKIATDGVLFIYKEKRNENNETGYYTNFKFKDAAGNKTQSIHNNDIIQLRKSFLEANPTYFDEVYGQHAEDDEYGDGENGTSFVISDDMNGEYAYFMDKVQARAGLVPVIDPDAEIEDEDDDSDDDYGWSSPSPFTTNKVVASGGGVSASALDDEPSAIEPHIYGIPYDNKLTLGRGFLAFSFLDPPGIGEVQLSDYSEYLGKLDKLMSSDIEPTMHPKDTDTNPVDRLYYAKFISTSSQAESLTKTSANVAVTTAAAGVSAGTGSTNNFKFGLTSTTLVIHYEVTEVDYRKFTNKDLNYAWDELGFLDTVSDYPTKKAREKGWDFLREFRNDFGDYYVSGYQYGACFDAYISISTQTSEQVKELEQKLSGNLTYNGVTVSADAAKHTRDALNEAKAEVSVRIVTSGMGHGPVELKLNHGSRDIAAVDDVFSNLMDFHNALGQNLKRSDFSPVRVRMTRYRQNLKMAKIFKEKGDITGLIPITIGQAVKIVSLNNNLRALRAYRNVVMDNSQIGSTYTKPLEDEFKSIITKVTTANERLYTGENQADFDAIVKRVNDLSPKFKALGDRYAFYTKLVIAQNEEKKAYDTLKAAADKAGEGSDTAYENVRKMPFNADHGGSSGYDQFAVSEYVTADIKAGGKPIIKQYKRKNGGAAYRREWKSDHKKGDQDFWQAAGAALITAKATGGEARFCKVWVNSLDKDSVTDRHRELVKDSTPAVGKKSVGFYFMSGRGDNVDWNIGGQSMRMKTEDYPFNGLQ